MKRTRIPMKVAMVASILSLTAMPFMAQAAEWKQDVTGAWMLVDDSGLSSKGWQSLNGNTYYFDELGHMLTGKQEINGSTYYFNENGIMMRDWWLKDGYSHFGTAWYYFQADGTMAHGWTMASDGKVYYFDSPGYPGATWTISGSGQVNGVGPNTEGIASVDFNYVYGDVTEIRPIDMTCSEGEFWYTLKSKLGVSDEIASKLVSLVPGKWYQQADRCAAALYQQGYDKTSAYNTMIAKGFTEDQATWATCMKWPTINEQGLWLNENGEYVTAEQLTDSHKNDINTNIDEEYRHDSSTDIRYQEGIYTYTMTGVNAYRENSNVSANPGLTLEDFNYFQDIEKPGENPGYAWQGVVAPVDIPDDTTTAIVPVTRSEDGSWNMDIETWNKVNDGLQTGEYHALNYPTWLSADEINSLPSPIKSYAQEHGLNLEDVYNAAKGITAEDDWIYIPANQNIPL